MQLSRFTDYSFRVLMFVALQPQHRSSITEIASSYDISRHHIVKVVHRLGSLGYLATYRGRGGGVELARSADSIRLGRLAAVTEDFDLVECFSAPGRCAIDRGCRLKPVLEEARDAFLDVLDRYSLADLVAPRVDLIQLLGGRPRSALRITSRDRDWSAQDCD